jgi:2-amino-4-hydroxy-6-hydroxymethyldihydropteridine diphosphokinase
MTAIVIALGSNLYDRAYNLRRAVHELQHIVTLTRVSSMYDTAPVDAPAGSPPFLNMVVAGHTQLHADVLLERLLALETRMGRRRRERNGPRLIDLDLILYGATLLRTRALTLPHPRYREREFVLAPLRELQLPWRDPATNIALTDLHGT